MRIRALQVKSGLNIFHNNGRVKRSPRGAIDFDAEVIFSRYLIFEWCLRFVEGRQSSTRAAPRGLFGSIGLMLQLGVAEAHFSQEPASEGNPAQAFQTAMGPDCRS